MDIDDFITATPFLYHLTDSRNMPFIKRTKKLLSAVELGRLSAIEDFESFVKTRRPDHTKLTIDSCDVFIRDQKPLNRALDKCLTNNWTREDYIYHLNRRVFTWPTIDRLTKHYDRYASENPIILRFNTGEILKLNKNAEITNLNSGATRPLGILGGVAPARGKDTFKPFKDYHLPVRSVAEVTFLDECVLPKTFHVGTSPIARWSKIEL